MKSFTWRLTLWFSLIVTLTTAGLLLVGGWLLHRQLIDSIRSLHTIEGEELISLIGPREQLSEADIAHIIKAEADSDAALFFIQVHHRNGQVLFRSDNLGESILPLAVIEHEHWSADVPHLGRLLISEFRRGSWHIQVASRLSPVWRVLRDYSRVSGLLVIGAAGLGVGIGYGFCRLTLRPVRAIETTARRIRADNLGERIVVPGGNDELASLARLLNQMFDRIEAAFAEVKQFTANASHELKTPLTLVRLNIEKLRPRIQADPEMVRIADDLSEEVRRLHQIIESLLFLSKADSGLLALQHQVLTLPDWLQAFTEDARALAEDRGSRFEMERCDEGTLEGEPHLLRHLLLNLVSNALAAAPAGSLVTLNAFRQGRDWCWVVADEGPGLAPEHLERIFGRFVRLRPSPESVETGHGLGLAISRSIARLHAGSIRAENRSDRSGLLVLVTLPATRSTTNPAIRA